VLERGLAAVGGGARGGDGGRRLHEVAPAHVGRRREAREVAHRTAADRHHGGAAVETSLEEPVPSRSGHFEGLGALALGKEHGGDLEAGGVEARRHGLTVELQDAGIGHEGDLAADLEAPELGASLAEHTRADEVAVRARAEADGNLDHESLTAETTSS